jgi:hypothetical protein
MEVQPFSHPDSIFNRQRSASQAPPPIPTEAPSAIPDLPEAA